MDTFWIIILLTAVGLLLISVDFYLPGFVLGTFGILLMLAAVGFEYRDGGLSRAAGLFVLEVALGIFGGYVSIHYGPRTATGKKMILAHTQTNQRAAAGAKPELVGITGTAHTFLRPAGIAELNGQRLDVLAESGLIESGSAIKVVAVDGTRIIVRKV